jgi:hypothetical protein
MQALRADECRANALHCVDVAQHAYARDERTEFLAFAECWYRLADEIDISNRLVDFIDGLPASTPMANTEAREVESGIGALKRLTSAIAAISSSFVADQLAAVNSGPSDFHPAASGRV